MVPQQQRRRRRRAALVRTSERRVVVARGPGGFGFTIAGQRPCVVSAVAAGGPAERAGLRAGDALIAVDGANVARAPHASVARLVAAAPGAIALSVAPREAPPTDTEDTEPDERARTRRRHPPPRRRPQPAMLHHPACHAPSTSADILQLSRAQLTPAQAARLECRAVVGYLGTIDTPSAAAPAHVRSAVRKLRQERRPATPVLLSVLPNALNLRRPGGQILAQYQRERILYAGCGSDADRRYFGLVTAAETEEQEASHSCHVFAVDPRMSEHEAHLPRAREFQLTCTRDAVAERCLEFPPSAEYVVGVVKGMYSLPADDNSPNLAQISKLAIKGDSPAFGNFSRCNRAVFRVPRERRPPCRHDDRLERLEAQDFVANSPQPSNHSEVTTTSSNSDSGIGFHNDCRNIADRILVVDFAGPQPPLNRFRQEMPRRPLGLVGCSFEDASFLSNTTPVVDGFAGQGRPLNSDDGLNSDLQARHVSPRSEEDNYNYNAYGVASTSSSRSFQNGVVYDQVYTEPETHHYELPDIQIDRVAEAFNSVEIYEEKPLPSETNEERSFNSIEIYEENLILLIQIYMKSRHQIRSMNSMSMSERPMGRRQASLDDILVLGRPPKNDDDNFVHPATVKSKVRKLKPLNLLSKTKHILIGRERDKKLDRARARALSASAGDVAAPGGEQELPAAASEPDLRQSEQTSPFRRWTTGSGAGSSYRHHHDPRAMYNKQISEGAAPAVPGAGGVARWSLGLEQLLADPAGSAAFAHFLSKEFAAENIRFWWSCEQYAAAPESGRAALAQEIWSRHLGDKAPEPVNVDAAARRATELRMHQTPAPQDLFQQAQKQIFNVMKFDSYPRFLRSGVHAECARADLRGLPAPYAPRATQPDPPTPTKCFDVEQLKKSASNASERRRSGGSILPWRLRAGSRDRAPEAPITDLVKSNMSGQCSLCRVVLPDGASSVVGVDASLTVRRLVERLLQRLNLPCPNYDVIVRDDQGECSTIDPSQPSTVLSGREAVVERRCVVRVEVAGKVVAVRCRPQRRAAHVLKPVLRRYLPRASRYRLLRDAAPLPLDTPVQELDGARLLILEIPGGDEVTEVECELSADDELDSLSEMALRLHDDNADTQSGAAGSGGGAGAERACARRCAPGRRCCSTIRPIS
ncbi:LOW QUALITY PROTEIN: regulator of G-protein signaling loco [Leguminivora glycinivorella]|uniref:LOW QUALITY PROTEIN: regulator of G-protein signaling loco n=1 Tax=Leguminivora glycinivorella TaxID=1035111 RepID=UPI00200FEAD5|nr:LOW QUALITY PROTEIN: regulator of G-protein signaling loco [Leguminivora glycinivorella]